MSYLLTKLSAHWINFLVLEIISILKTGKKIPSSNSITFLRNIFCRGEGGKRESLLRQVTAKHYFQRLGNKMKHTGQTCILRWLYSWTFCILLTSCLKGFMCILKYSFPLQCKTSVVSQKNRNTWLMDWTDASITFGPCAFTQTCFHQSSELELEGNGSAKSGNI